MQPPKHALLPILIFLLAAFFSNVSADSTTEAVDRLRPIDTASPRALVESYHRGLVRVMELLQQKDVHALRRQVQQITMVFDFSETPPALVDQQG